MATNQKRVDPRFAGMFGQDKGMLFIATALSLALGEERTQEVFDTLGNRGVDFTERVAGVPLHRFMGKTADDLRNEGRSEDDIEAVRKAYAARGLEFPETKAGTPDASDASPGNVNAGNVPNATPAGTPAGTPTGTGPANPGPGSGGKANPEPEGEGDEEPVYGTDEIPLHKLAGKSDEDLLKIEGIGPKTVAKIREDEKKAAGRPRKPRNPNA